MAATIKQQPLACQATSVDHDHAERSTAIDQALLFLRQAKEETGWTLDALEAHMDKGRAYIDKVLNGEKPMSLAFEVALPKDLRAAYNRKSLEACGHIVVEPLSSHEAMRALVSGLAGVLSAQLPGRADRMAKASLPFVERRNGTR